MEKIIIAAVSENFVIGKNGKIPWYSKEELQHFKETTSGFPVIMGRKTWESIGKPLINRINIILTHNKFYKTRFPDVIISNSLEEALNYCKKEKFKKVFIIGGAAVFKEAIMIVDTIILSKMKINVDFSAEVDGDAFFPKIDSNFWKLKSVKEFTEFTVYNLACRSTCR